MTSLEFTVEDIVPEPWSVAPNLVAKLHIEETTGEQVHALVLRAQVRIDAHRRGYSADEEPGLLDLFGPRRRWTETLKPFLWMHAMATVQGFTGATDVDLVLPCTYDFEVSGAKYLHALREGTIPLELLFSGTVFARGSTGFSVTQIPWDREARYELPVRHWRTLMDHYFPNAGWLRLERGTLDALNRYKSTRGMTSWDEALTSLLPESEEAVR
ncbi:MAG: Uncharacterized protein MSMEG_2716 [uncultured Nocardioidaceae bacterium]|uniref:Uncharacterized protein MSMEG_2716 n=1 Tax=uncultured Nocardioidaceae bacterium TaxID=253824 RepID=A0A6J4LJ83_9ACTN|nr:MAG: Uncharacterized protein MSMEG_2716 [uncultured Nocardioidaceae bacterium]